VREGLLSHDPIYTTRAGPALGAFQHKCRVRRGPSSARQLVRCGRRHLAFAARPKCALYGGREFLVHPLELLGRIGADIVAGPRDVGPKL
jgi:hypothetical protein